MFSEEDYGDCYGQDAYGGYAQDAYGMPVPPPPPMDEFAFANGPFAGSRAPTHAEFVRKMDDLEASRQQAAFAHEAGVRAKKKNP